MDAAKRRTTTLNSAHAVAAACDAGACVIGSHGGFFPPNLSS
jgi:hypothetical protein